MLVSRPSWPWHIRTITGLIALSGASLLSSASALAQSVTHPMDPLTHDEHWTVVDVLRDAGRVDEETGFTLVTLHSPQKGQVLAWRPGAEIPRAAFAILKKGPDTFEAVVDLISREVESWEGIEGVQPTWLDREFGAGGRAVLQNPEFRAALERRGITDYTDLVCWALPLGTFDRPERRGRRIATVSCADAHGARTFPWNRVVEGLAAYVDMDSREILEVVDEGVVPMPERGYRYDDETIGPKRVIPTPISVEQPGGPSFELDGHVVRWQNWSFHHRVDPRVGLILSDVRYLDGDRSRSILYEGHLSEIFVPYMDPATPWYAFNFLDAGEYSAGGLAKPMTPGFDCPANAVMFDALVGGDDGKPTTTPNASCIYERYAGDVAWRHFDDFSGTTETRAKRDLVVRMIAVLGNYDYVFDWVFQQNGTIEVRLAATGISNVKAVAQELAVAASEASGMSAANGGGLPAANGGGLPAADRPDAYGRFVAPNLVAVNHDHFFSFRLDLDVDGPSNSLQVDELKTVRLADDHPRRSVWVVEPTIAQREVDATRRLDFERPALWRIINPSSRNGVGYPVSYHLMPRSNALSLMVPEDYPQGRAGFINHHLWVTPYAPQERYAAGTYPTLSEPGQGLPRWTAANRSISAEDIVVWYTVGMHHVVRAEDFPVMPVSWQAFELRPFDFFDRNPAIDLPRTP
jgi:primary-amine oxidase